MSNETEKAIAPYLSIGAPDASLREPPVRDHLSPDGEKQMHNDDRYLLPEATEIVGDALKRATGLLREHLPRHSPTDAIRLTEIILDRAFLLEQDANDDGGEAWNGD